MNKYLIYILITLLLPHEIFANAQTGSAEPLYIKYPENPGLHIVSISEMSKEETEKHRQIQIEMKEMQEKGYAHSDTEDPLGIFSIQYASPGEHPDGIELTDNIHSIKLAFPYEGLNFISSENSFGFYGSYFLIGGSLGIGQYFKVFELGICNYERNNRALAHAEVRLVRDDLNYEINHKPSQYIIRGSEKTGYSAYVDWYDKTYIHHLQCANREAIPDIYKVFDLAIRIDQV